MDGSGIHGTLVRVVPGAAVEALAWAANSPAAAVLPSTWSTAQVPPYLANTPNGAAVSKRRGRQTTTSKRGSISVPTIEGSRAVGFGDGIGRGFLVRLRSPLGRFPPVRCSGPRRCAAQRGAVGGPHPDDCPAGSAAVERPCPICRQSQRRKTTMTTTTGTPYEENGLGCSGRPSSTSRRVTA